MDGSNTTDIIQNHSGSGDNVGTKYYQVFQALTPQHLAKQVAMVFSSIREKDDAKAAIQIEVIQSAENLDDRARSILKILSVHLGLTDTSASIEAYPPLLSFLATAKSEIESDICLAALLRLDLKNGKMPDAVERYNQAKIKGEYSKELYYELIADADSLQKEYGDFKLLMREGELNGIIRGAFRTENHELLQLAIERLSETFPSYNSKVFCLIKDAQELNPELIKNQSFYISRSTKEKIDSILLRTEALILESNGVDPRLFDIAISLLEYTGWIYPNIMETCWTFVTSLEKNHPSFASQLHIAYNNDFTYASGIVKTLGEAKSDPFRKQEIAKSVINSKTIDSDSLPLLFEMLTPSEMRQWINSGGSFVIENDLERQFVKALFYSHAIPNSEDRLALEELRSQANELVEKHLNDLKQINQQLLLRFCQNLERLNLDSICCKILKFLLPDKDLWLSPGFIIYLKSLLASHQLLTLEAILADLDPSEWTPSVWQIKAMAQEQAGDLDGSLNSAEQMIKGAPGNLAASSYYAHLSRKNGATDLQVSKIFEDIPDRAFASYSPEALRALVLIANFQDFKRAEKILLDWFSQNPTTCATAITQFHFNLLERENLQTSMTVEGYIAGYKYSKEGEILTKLVVKNKTNDNSFTIDSESPLGMLLSGVAIGETANHNMQDVILLEKLDPYTTIFRLALQIRNLNNDGSDVFSMMQVPEDPSMLISVLKRKFAENKAQQEARHNTISTSTLPIFFKGFQLNNGNPIKAALEQLTDNSSTKSDLPNIGVLETTTAIIDPYTACYLSLTGLAYSLAQHPTKFNITLETRAAITEWISEVSNPSYMTIGTNDQGDLVRTTSEDIAVQFKALLDGLKLILDNAETVHPKLYDFPDKLIQLEQFFDRATFSTIKASVTNDIPWLCIDEALAQLHNSLNHKLMQTYSTCTDLGYDLNFDQKSKGLFLHSIKAIPYALTYKDLLTLASEEDARADFALAEILKNHRILLSSNHNSTDVVSKALAVLILKAYKQKELDNLFYFYDPFRSKYFEKAFNASLEIIIASSPEQLAEFKIAKFFYEFTIGTEILQQSHRFLAVHISFFCQGHFLSIDGVNDHLQKLRTKFPTT